MKNICIIPARGGSKRIPRKNIKPFMGKPIIAYSIEAALQSGLFEEVMVSTDDEEIAAMLAPFRGEVKPFSPTFIPKLSGQPETREQTNTGQPGFWHRALNFWSGLRQREKKTIVSGIFYLFGVIFGSVRKKK